MRAPLAGHTLRQSFLFSIGLGKIEFRWSTSYRASIVVAGKDCQLERLTFTGFNVPILTVNFRPCQIFHTTATKAPVT